MITVLRWLIGSAMVVLLTGCGVVTRTEQDRFTITIADSTTVEQVRNQPGDRENGIIFPSSTTITKERWLRQYDSVETRDYPAFVRLAVFESVGLVGSSLDGSSVGYGLFGVYTPISTVLFGADPAEGADIFKGGISRFGIGEWKLHWFTDDPDWTWGITAYETIRPDNNASHLLMGAGVLSIRKRFYLRSRIPYVAITPQLHVAAFPSQYVNAGASADVGSIGGLNMRLYAGYAMGRSLEGTFVNFPYAGVGVSLLDFLNREEELDTEWKFHEHSAWNIGVVEAMLLGATNVSGSVFGSRAATSTGSPLTGLMFRLFNTTLAVPLWDHRVSVGTSLATFVALGQQEFALGILPLRVGYVWQPTASRFTVEPFVEVGYAPSTFVQVAAKASLPVSDQLSLMVTAGYISGETIDTDIVRRRGPITLTNPTAFQGFYLGIGASIFDRIFRRDELRYGKGYPHE